MDILVDCINFILDSFVEGVNALVGWIPDSPFQEPIASMRSMIGSETLGYINYFLPISEMLAFLSLWVTAIVLYYVTSIILRWAKAIS